MAGVVGRVGCREGQLWIRDRLGGGTSVFELRTGEHHDHIVCNKCGQVQEFYDEVIEEQQEKIARKYEFKITDHSLYLYGLCAACQS